METGEFVTRTAEDLERLLKGIDGHLELCQMTGSSTRCMQGVCVCVCVCVRVCERERRMKESPPQRVPSQCKMVSVGCSYLERDPSPALYMYDVIKTT